MEKVILTDPVSQTTLKTKHKLNLIFGLGIMLFATLVYSLTLSTGVFPGASASLMATYTGIEPQIAPAHPIWGALVGIIGKMGAAGMAFRLNLFSMILAVGCVGMLYALVSALIFKSIDTQKVSQNVAVVASVVGAAVASLALAFCVPFWITATRLHYQVFDLFLLLALSHLFVAYINTGKSILILLFSLFFGISVVECASIAPFAALFIFCSFVYWTRRDDFKGSRLFGCIVFSLIGLSFYFLVAKNFCDHNDISLRGYDGYKSVLVGMLQDQIHMFKEAIPELGWLFIVIFIILPWIASLAIAPRALSDNRDWSFLCFHIALSAIAVATLTNSPISRWGLELAKPQGALPVFLYTLTAMLSGYLVAYWYVIIFNRDYIPEHQTNLPNVKFSIWCAYALGATIAVIVPLSAAINGFEADGKRGAFADDCARILLDNLEGRPWLITDGMFDNHLRLAAAEKGRELKLIELQKNDSPIYIRQLKKMIETDPDFKAEDRVMLQNSAELGVTAFIQDWIKGDSNVIDRIAIMSAPDLLIGADCTVVPNYFCFIGIRDREQAKNMKVLETFSPFWTKMQNVLAKSRKLNDPISEYRALVRRQVGFVANNAGVMLEDFGRDEEAYQVYNIVRSIDPENISAILNRLEMLHRKEKENFHSEDKAKVEKELQDFISKMKHQLPIWSLSRSFGYVRSPVLFAQLGMTWALSGQPGMALAGMERAAGVATTSASRVRVREAMADILLQQNDVSKSESIYEDILSDDPENKNALLAMSRIAARRGSLDKAREWLDKAKSSGVDSTSIAIESAALDLASNKPEDARVKLVEVTELNQRNLQAWSMLAIAVIQMRDFDEVEKRIIPKMEAVAGTMDHYLIHITRGQLAYSKGKNSYGAARESFERAAALRPGLPILLEWILRLDFMLTDKVAAESHARTLLRQDRDNGFANYIMGSLMLERGRNAEAEDYLRRSVGSSRSPEALNDLAELLRKTGNYAEAEKQVRAAIDLAPDFYITYDTLGGILSDTQHISEAEKAYEKALSMFDDDLRVHLNLAKLLYKKGDLVGARKIVSEKIQPRKSELPPAEQADLQQLVRDLTPGKK